MSPHDVVVIGAGPAGIAAAIQLKRQGFDPLLIEQNAIGGLLRNANLIENYPGFPEGISGSQLVELFREQLERTGITITFECVQRLDHDGKTFVIATDQKTISSRIVVIASGTKPLKLPSLFQHDDVKEKILYEAYPLFAMQQKRIAIIGAGDFAFDYALNLSKHNEVVILNRSDRVNCLPLLRRRAMKDRSISYCERTEVKSIARHDDGVLLTSDSHNGERQDFAHYLLIAIGREPSLDFVSAAVRENLHHWKQTHLSYLIGDVANNEFRQTAIAVGNGVRAAMEIERTLKEKMQCT